MSVEFKHLKDNGIKVDIEVDCPCEIGICDHALVEVKKALQKSYDQGIFDGAHKAMSEFQDALKNEFPKEFEKAARKAKESRLN